MYDALKDKKEYITGLKVTYFPEELREYLNITTREGAEFVDVDRLQLYRDFYKRVVEDNEPVEPLKEKYQRYEYIMREYCKEIHKKKPTFENADIFMKFTPAEERRMADWKMFAELRKSDDPEKTISSMMNSGIVKMRHNGEVLYKYQKVLIY